MIKQLAIFIENQEGCLRRATEALHQEGISIYALSTVDSPEFGILRMIIDQPEQGRDKLEQSGFVARICEVIAVEMEQQNTMDELLKVIHEGNVNINYIYSSFCGQNGRPVLILHADDMDETEAMLQTHGFECLDKVGAARI